MLTFQMLTFSELRCDASRKHVGTAESRPMSICQEQIPFLLVGCNNKIYSGNML